MQEGAVIPPITTIRSRAPCHGPKAMTENSGHGQQNRDSQALTRKEFVKYDQAGIVNSPLILLLDIV